MLQQYADRWAFVTGASSGIGAEFARELAARGMHLVLTARREEMLQELAEDLHTRHGTHSLIMPGDLSEPEFAPKLIEELDRQEVAIELLINNAGFGIACEIENTSREEVQKMLRVNVESLTDLTYLLLPRMLERGHGAVINVSSISGFQPVAFMPAYAATKAYILNFSEALWAECHTQGVSVMALCPGITNTNFFNIAGVPSWLKKRASQTPEQVVRSALRGLEKKRQYWVTGWRNYILTNMSRFVSRRVAVTQSMKYYRPRGKKVVEEQPEEQNTTSP